jgi:hypothetical protein
MPYQLGIKTDVSNDYSEFIFGFNQSKNEDTTIFRNDGKILEYTLRNIPECCHIVLQTHPPSHLLFHERHEQVEYSQEGWFKVDMMHAFGTNRVGILEQCIYLHDHFRTTITTKTVIIYGQYVNTIHVMELKCKKRVQLRT